MSVLEILLKSYQVRKSRKQKDAFIDFLKSRYPDMRVEISGAFKSRNLIFGDIESAKIVYGAHYDTCAHMIVPNIVLPRYPILRLLYSVLMVVPLVLLMLFAEIALIKIGVPYELAVFISLALYFAGLFGMFFAGPANKHTANDNTSGVAAVLEIMEKVGPDSPAAFVLFDNEECGCLGSAAFYKQYKAQMQDKLLFNLDCIGDGDELLIIANAAAREKWGARLEDAFPENGGMHTAMADAKKVKYTSDQRHFPVSVAAAAFRKHKAFGLILDKIHTSRDTVCSAENVNYIVERAAKLAE